ncbi:MAG TPA: 2-phospho-L-lactate transferase CofD family protein [Solirubrobacteraceae bacterium]|nr:2-phospho-L-lactate transferase CofD family protein [Solirubrobacteraceae bacterium]
MSTSRATLPRQSRSSKAIVVLGGGRGLACVLNALRNQDADLTVIVNIAIDGESRQLPSPRAVEDLRRSLEALTGEEGALLRAIRRPLTVGRLGEEPLGNLVLGSVASAFGDYGTASRWLGEKLGVAGAVLPATTQPVSREVEPVAEGSTDTPSATSGHELMRLRFTSEQIETPAAAISAIEQAHWALLAPGSLYRSVLSTAAVPEVASALSRTRGQVVWIASAAPGSREAADMAGVDHLRALHLHGVRVDVVLHDPSATLRFDSTVLASYGVQSVARAVCSRRDRALHDPARLRAALEEMIGSRAYAPVRD